MNEHHDDIAALGETARRFSEWRKRLAVRIRDWGSRRFPSLVDSTFKQISREYYRVHDETDIPKSIPPEDNRVALKSILAAEFYTPAHAARLMQAFKDMGWDSERTSAFNQSSADWVIRSRRDGLGGWINLGGITRPADANALGRGAKAELPNGFDRAHAELFSISSSLSCIVVTFTTSEETERAYEVIARQPFSTELRSFGRGYTIVSPRSRKQELIGDAREKFRHDILQWFTTHLPGAFAASGSLERFPTCELLFTDNVRPKKDEQTEKSSVLAEYLGLDRHLEYWDCTTVLGLTFSHPVSHRVDRKGHAALAIERTALQAIENSMYGGQTDDAYLNRFSMLMPALVSQWALIGLLKLYQDEINTLRDSGLVSDPGGEATEVLRRSQRVTSNSVDISLLSSELPTALRMPMRNSLEFHLVYPVGREPISLLESLHCGTLEAIKQLESSDKIVRDLLIQQGNLINALETVAVQREMSKLTTAMTWLTVLIFILTAGMAYVAVFPLANNAPSSNVSLFE